MAATPSELIAAIAFKSSSRRALAAAAFSWELASWVMARSVNQYFRSPKCLLAVVAVRTMETNRACSARLCEWRISSRISSAEDTARIASNRTERKISRARIDTCDIELVPSLHLLLRLRDKRLAHRPGGRAPATRRPSRKPRCRLRGSARPEPLTLWHGFL